VDVVASNTNGSFTLTNGYEFIPQAGQAPRNLTDVDTLDLYPYDEVRHAVTGLPGSLYYVFLSFGGGPVLTPYGLMGLNWPIYFFWNGYLNSYGYQTVTLTMPYLGYGFIQFYTHALVDDFVPIWAIGGNNPNGTGSIVWGLNSSNSVQE
jgi:hypothetical protein